MIRLTKLTSSLTNTNLSKASKLFKARSPLASFQFNFTSSSDDEPPRIERDMRAEWTVDSPDELKELIKNNKVYIVDVREPFEVSQGRVNSEKYVNVPIGQVFQSMRLSDEEFLEKYGAPRPGKDSEEIVAMCLGGVRSTWAMQTFHHFGFSKTRHYPGGWSEWRKVFPKEKV